MSLPKYSTVLPLIEHVLSLLVIFLLLTATAVWTGSLFGHPIGAVSTKPSALQSEEPSPTAEQLTALGLHTSETELTPRDSASWYVRSVADKKGRGIIISSRPYAKEITGFAGPTPLYILIGTDGTIQGIAAADNAETPHFFHRAFDKLAPQWYGRTPTAASGLKVDAVSGATFSSKAVTHNVQAALSAYAAADDHHIASPTIGWWRTAAVAITLAIGITAALLTVRAKDNRRSPVVSSPKHRKYIRIIVHALNVAVLGFWCGQFLSVSLLRGWLSSGIDPLTWLPTLLVLGVAIVLPFFGRKHYYCSWICPYGSLQELAAMLPLPKLRLPATVYKWMPRLRMGVLALLLLLLWSGVGAFILDYEPFTAFMLHAAAPAVVILAGTFILAGCFIPHLWCRSLCPMGQLLDLSER